MGLLLDPDEFLANKDLHKVPLSDIERKIIPKPIPDLRLYSMTAQQLDCIVDQILANNPTDAEIDAHLAAAFALADESNKILIQAMQQASTKRQLLDDFLAYEKIHRRLVRTSLQSLHNLKRDLLTFHTKGIQPSGFSRNAPDLKLFLVHKYRHQAQCHPIGLDQLTNIFLSHNNIETDRALFSRSLNAQTHQPLPIDSLPFTDPLAAVSTAA